MFNHLKNADLFKIDIWKEINNFVKKKVEETFQKSQSMKNRTNYTQDENPYPMFYAQEVDFRLYHQPVNLFWFLIWQRKI